MDATTGQRAPAFDHTEAARELSAITGSEVRAEKLPIDALEVRPGGELLLYNENHAWTMNLTTGRLSDWTGPIPSVEALKGESEIRPSARTGPHTRITFENHTGGDLLVSWIDAEGKRHPYFKVARSSEREQGTYSGHVWLVTDPNGNILGVYEATDDPARALVDRKVAESAAGRDTGPAGRTSPDGRWIAFTRDHNIWLRGLVGSEESPLTHDGTAEDFYEEDLYWSPDQSTA